LYEYILLDYIELKMKTGIQQIIDIARQKGRISTDKLAEIGANRTILPYLAQRGILRRIARGIYVPADQIMQDETFQAVSLAVPHGVICLLSALQFHEITTQMPMETWIAVERGRTIPKSENLHLRIVQLSHEHFCCGIDECIIQGIKVRVYSPAKTVVDCFKFRNTIGIDIALEALKQSISQSKATKDEIWRYAKICRMLNVMRPYLEMI
jgi:predicted transcriptional regulator of viral defense system